MFVVANHLIKLAQHRANVGVFCPEGKTSDDRLQTLVTVGLQEGFGLGGCELCSGCK